MGVVKYTLTKHAKDVLEERELPVAWLEHVLDAPERVEPDPDGGTGTSSGTHHRTWQPRVARGREQNGSTRTRGHAIFRPHHEEQAMKLRIDKEADALYLRLDDAKIIESEQVAPGVIVDFDSKNRVVGLEVLNVSKRAPKSKRSPGRITAATVVREKPAKKYGK
jgi:uncharacterized protein YuzE